MFRPLPSQMDDADGKLMADYVLVDNVVVLMVGVGPQRIIVLADYVKANAHSHHLRLHPHLHLHLHNTNVECKMVARNVIEPESVVVYRVCVETHTSIVFLDIVRCNVQVHIQRDDADGKLMVNHVLLDNVVVTLVGVESAQAFVTQFFVKVNVAVHQSQPQNEMEAFEASCSMQLLSRIFTFGAIIIKMLCV